MCMLYIMCHSMMKSGKLEKSHACKCMFSALTDISLVKILKLVQVKIKYYRFSLREKKIMIYDHIGYPSVLGSHFSITQMIHPYCKHYFCNFANKHYESEDNCACLCVFLEFHNRDKFNTSREKQQMLELY